MKPNAVQRCLARLHRQCHVAAGSGGAMRAWRLNRVHPDRARLALAEGAPQATLQALDEVQPWPASECAQPHPDVAECGQLPAQARSALERPPQG